MKANKTKYYLIKFRSESDYTWLAIAQNGKLIKEYNLYHKIDVTNSSTEGYKNNFFESLKVNIQYEYKEISKKEAFLIML